MKPRKLGPGRDGWRTGVDVGTTVRRTYSLEGVVVSSGTGSPFHLHDQRDL